MWQKGLHLHYSFILFLAPHDSSCMKRTIWESHFTYRHHSNLLVRVAFTNWCEYSLSYTFKVNHWWCNWIHPANTVQLHLPCQIILLYVIQLRRRRGNHLHSNSQIMSSVQLNHAIVYMGGYLKAIWNVWPEEEDFFPLTHENTNIKQLHIFCICFKVSHGIMWEVRWMDHSIG